MKVMGLCITVCCWPLIVTGVFVPRTSPELMSEWMVHLAADILSDCF